MATRVGDPATLLPVPTHKSASKFPLKRNPGDPKPPRRKPLVTVDAAIGNMPNLANGGGVQKANRAGGTAYSKFQRSLQRGTRTLYNHVCHALTEVNLSRISHVPEGGNWRDIPFELLPAGMQRAHKSDHTKRYGRLNRRGLASTILTKCDPHWGAYIHPTEDRTISVREAARLQGFPDRFRFAGDSIGKHYEQVGNAVPVPVARALGLTAKAHLEAPQERAEPLSAIALGKAA